MKNALVQVDRAGKLLSSLRALIAREYPEVKRSTQIIYCVFFSFSNILYSIFHISTNNVLLNLNKI